MSVLASIYERYLAIPFPHSHSLRWVTVAAAFVYMPLPARAGSGDNVHRLQMEQHNDVLRSHAMASQQSCRRAKVAADGNLRRVHRCSQSPWSCTETAISCFDSIDAALGKVSKVFADYLTTNFVEILAFWIAVSTVCVVVGGLK